MIGIRGVHAATTSSDFHYTNVFYVLNMIFTTQ